MEISKSTAVVLGLIRELKRIRPWCGETHIQKTMYFLQEAFCVSTNFDFIMYKHGPYSFDLSDLLVSLQANGVVNLTPQQYPYGPSFGLTEDGEKFIGKFVDDLKDDIRKIKDISNTLGTKKVVELERLGTALYVIKKIGVENNIELKADEITRLKPHISRQKAIDALEEVNEILAT